ncbi:MAG: tRNA threonylcarbamoyladenosine dehydratase [Myxococcales bacterium]|nr:tRNA threonylcarbamoyladenosine dehydratase [Myxococcales bacterium]
MAEIIAEQMPTRDANGKPTWKLHRRWDRAARLFGEEAMERLAHASVTIMGLGGVGSFAAEGLIRAGVGRLVLVDFDDVCVTNVNRQLHAMKGAYSKPKCDLMAERMRRINPAAEIVPVKAFYNQDTSEALLADEPDFVVDAIDNFTAKLHLLARCLELGLPVVSSMGAAGKMDPTQIKIADISDTYGDPMARSMRKLLRQKHGLGRNQEATGIPAVFSPEARTPPQELSYDAASNGFLCVCPSRANDFHSCDSRNLIDGSAGFVTSVFGMVASSVVVRRLTGHPIPELDG